MNKLECSIFIVDDDSSLCRALARLLKTTGYPNIRTFSSAEDFLHSEALERHGILILDLQLPGISGIDLLQYLRGTGNNIPVILISAHDEELTRAKGMDHASVAFLHKPFEEKELVSVIGSALD